MQLAHQRVLRRVLVSASKPVTVSKNATQAKGFRQVLHKPVSVAGAFAYPSVPGVFSGLRNYSTSQLPPKQSNETEQDWNKRVEGWKKIAVETAKFYWAGMKQLWTNHKQSRELKLKLASGEHLTRQQHLFLAQHRSDLMSLIPFIVIWALPFSGLLLPLAVGFFPGLLPSTLHTPEHIHKAMTRSLETRKKLAHLIAFIFETEFKHVLATYGVLQSLVVQFDAIMAKARSVSWYRLSTNQPLTLDCIQQYRKHEVVSASELEPFVELFQKYFELDEIPAGKVTEEGLGGMLREQWKAMAAYPELIALAQHIGVATTMMPAPYIRGRVKKTMAQLKFDDKQIANEGGESSLTDAEVAAANDARGLQSIQPASVAHQRWLLQQWLQLSTNKDASTSLLVFFAALNAEVRFNQSAN